MTRTTQADIRQIETVINNVLAQKGSAHRIEIEWAYGQPKAYIVPADNPTHIVERELSPRLPMGEMYAWLDAFAAGLSFTDDHK